MNHKACHVGYKHAGLQYTDGRKALQVKQIYSFKLCVLDLHLKQNFIIWETN